MWAFVAGMSIALKDLANFFESLVGNYVDGFYWAGSTADNNNGMLFNGFNNFFVAFWEGLDLGIFNVNKVIGSRIGFLE